MNTQKNNKIFISHYNHINIPNNYDLVLISDLKEIKDNSIKEIFVKDIIGTYTDQDLSRFFIEILSKLEYGGYLNIQDIDLEQFCLYLNRRILPFTEKKLLYYKRNNIFHMHEIVKIINGISEVTITQANFINGYEFFIQVLKNEQ